MTGQLESVPARFLGYTADDGFAYIHTLQYTMELAMTMLSATRLRAFHNNIRSAARPIVVLNEHLMSKQPYRK